MCQYLTERFFMVQFRGGPITVAEYMSVRHSDALMLKRMQI